MISHAEWEAREAAFAATHEYTVGAVLEVDFEYSGIAKGAIAPVLPEGVSKGTVSLEIIKVFPGNGVKSCLVRQVSLDADSTPEQVYFLRLFDRRCDRCWRDEPWTRHIEKRYRQYLAHCDGKPSDETLGDAPTWWDTYNERMSRSRAMQNAARETASGDDARRGTSNEEYEDRETIEDEFAGVREAWVERKYQIQFNHELKIYKTLHGLPRDCPVPRWLGQVTYTSPIGDVDGLLLEYIPNGITVRQYLRATVPCGDYDDQIARVCNEASLFQNDFVETWPIVFRHMSSHVVMVQFDTPLPPELEDATGDSALSHVLRVASPLRFYVVDLGSSVSVRLRAADESDDEWDYVKYLKMEKFHLGRKMHSDIRDSIIKRCKTHGWICRSDRSRGSGAVAIWAPEGHRATPRNLKPTKKERKEAKKRARAAGGGEEQHEAR